MAALNEKQIVAGVLLFAFLVLIMLSVQFMQDSSGNILIKEAFTSSGPTRASDCQCLPGYIPSNSGRADVKLAMLWNGTIILYTDTWAKLYNYYAAGDNDRIQQSNINILLRCMGLNISYSHYDNFTKDLENGSIPNCKYISNNRESEEIMNNKAIANIYKTSNNDIDSIYIDRNTACSAIQALPSSNKKGYSCLSLGDGSTKACY